MIFLVMIWLVFISSFIMSKSTPTFTEYFPGLIPAETASFAYEYLRDNIQWEQGILSRSGPTRLAKSLDLEDDDVVRTLVTTGLSGLSKGKNKVSTLAILGVYLNNYVTGEMYTPNHSHKGTSQIIISLGGTRTLNVGSKNFQMANGDVAIFGSCIHGIPKEDTKEGRISIAMFCRIVYSNRI